MGTTVTLADRAIEVIFERDGNRPVFIVDPRTDEARALLKQHYPGPMEAAEKEAAKGEGDGRLRLGANEVSKLIARFL